VTLFKKSVGFKSNETFFILSPHAEKLDFNEELKSLIEDAYRRYPEEEKWKLSKKKPAWELKKETVSQKK